MNNGMNNQGQQNWWGAQQVSPNNMPQTFDQNQMVMVDYGEPKPRKKKKLIIILLIILVILGVGTWFVLTKTDLIIKHDEDAKETEKKEKEKKGAYKFQGVFERGGYTIRIFPINEEEFRFSLKSDRTSIIGTATVKGNTASHGSFGNMLTFVYSSNDNSIVLTADDEKIPSDTYNFVQDYTIDDYFAENCGNPMYFNTKYNGVYSLGSRKMYVYQRTETTCRVILIERSSAVFDMEFDIKEDGSLYTTFFERVYTINLEGTSMVFKTTGDDKENDKDGTYTKEKTLKYEDVIEY